jgi:hypothetical protein
VRFLKNFFFYLTPADGSEKKNDGGGCRSAAHGTADPDGTGWNGRRKECQLCDETKPTKPQQHNTGRLALETTAVRMRRLAWSWSKLNNTTTTKSRLDLAWNESHCNVHLFNCVAACVDVGGHQL